MLLLFLLVLRRNLRMRFSGQKKLLLLQCQLGVVDRLWRLDVLFGRLFHVLLGLLLQLHRQLADLLLVGLFLNLLPDDFVHHFLHKGCAADPGLVGFDQDLFARLDRFLGLELDQIGATVVLHNLGLNNRLLRLGSG